MSHDYTYRQQKDLHLLALMIQTTLVQHTHQKRTTSGKSYLFFSARGSRAVMSLVKHCVVRPQKARHDSPAFHRSFHEKEPVSCSACEVARSSALTFHWKWLISQRLLLTMWNDLKGAYSLIDCNTKSTGPTLEWFQVRTRCIHGAFIMICCDYTILLKVYGSSE